jgi:hypothetical protein
MGYIKEMSSVNPGHSFCAVCPSPIPGNSRVAYPVRVSKGGWRWVWKKKCARIKAEEAKTDPGRPRRGRQGRKKKEKNPIIRNELVDCCFVIVSEKKLDCPEEEEREWQEGCQMHN